MELLYRVCIIFIGTNLHHWKWSVKFVGCIQTFRIFLIACRVWEVVDQIGIVKNWYESSIVLISAECYACFLILGEGYGRLVMWWLYPILLLLRCCSLGPFLHHWFFLMRLWGSGTGWSLEWHGLPWIDGLGTGHTLGSASGCNHLAFGLPLVIQRTGRLYNSQNQIGFGRWSFPGDAGEVRVRCYLCFCFPMEL